MNKTSKRTGSASKPKVGDEIVEAMDGVHLNGGGIDIGLEVHYVSVPEGRDNPHVRSFGCFTPDLEAMAAWLTQCRVKTVVMESTGVYWVPAYQVLEANGFDVKLGDGNHPKHAPSPKTDLWNSRCPRKLHPF